MFGFFKDLASALNPRVTDTPEQIFAWRQTVAISLILLAALSIFNTSRAYGWLEWTNIPGYVTTAQLGPLEQLVRETREDQLVQQILDLTRRYCLAYEVNDQSGMTFAFQSLQSVRAKYYLLMKREYPQLMCSMSAQPAKQTP